MQKSDFDLDVIWKELGNFGLFQFINFFFIGITIVFTGFFTLGYVFTAGDLEYR